jgi:ADP-ribosyl-[dinitrogen reductase] hydrolase
VDWINLERARNSLLGTALGDSLGLPYEGLSARRGRKLMPFPLRQRLLGNKGTISDDTVQSALVLSALMRCDGDIEVFRTLVGKDLRKWFLAIPPGIGLATIKACCRLLVGISPSRSGVDSAGNGAAMRSAVIGAALCEEPELRMQFVEASARVTHTHPDAIAGAQVIALAASIYAKGGSTTMMQQIAVLTPGWNWNSEEVLENPTGYVIPSVIAAIMCCIYPPRTTLEYGIERAISLGGDTDTIAAMVGGILGADPNFKPVDPSWMRYMGWPQPNEIAAISIESRFRASYLRLLGQHLVALPAILAFGFRRLLPPY